MRLANLRRWRWLDTSRDSSRGGVARIAVCGTGPQCPAARATALATLYARRGRDALRAARACGGPTCSLSSSALAASLASFAAAVAAWANASALAVSRADASWVPASAEPHEQNLSRCMELADVRFVNDGTVDEFHDQITQWVLASRGSATPGEALPSPAGAAAHRGQSG